MKEIPSYSNQDEKSKFFSLKIIDTDEQLFYFMSNLPKLSHEEQGIWRGLPESRYKLYNSLQRNNLLFRKLDTIEDVINSIVDSANLLDDWNRKLITKYFGNYKIDEVPIFAKLSILRHYEVPSPLLDWTRNPNVALFFAAQKQGNKIYRDEIDNYFAVYFITEKHPSYKLDFKLGYREVLENDKDFNDYVGTKVSTVIEHGGDNVLQREAKKKAETEYLQHALNNLRLTLSSIKNQYIQRIEDKPNDEIFHFIKNNYNITAQKGLFIMNADPFRPLEEAIAYRITELASVRQLPINDVDKAMITCRDNFICYDIHKKLRTKIIKYLKSVNITQETMKPDFKKLKDEITFEKITKNIRQNDNN